MSLSMSLLQMRDVIVESFERENFIELGIITGWGDYIEGHDRLLRSLDWNDPDHDGHVLEMLSKMQRRGDGSIEKADEYLHNQFSASTKAAKSVADFSGTKTVIGYQYEKSKNDLIAVMMPFAPSFTPVYQAISASCRNTGLPVQRADEVWQHSILINDILSLINHASIVICDLTGRNENVFYELGIAHAWGKDVVLVTQNADDVPFDLRHHRYITYLNNSEGLRELEKQLQKRVDQLVGN